MSFKKIWPCLLPVLFAIGCGGGGGGSVDLSTGGGTGGGTTGAAPASVPVFATDAPSPDFDHVWVTIYSVDAVSSSGSSVNLFTSSTGMQLDVRALRDSSGARFQFIDNAGIPAGTYTGVKVTLDKTVNIVKHGDSRTTACHFSDNNNSPQTSAKSTFSFAFNPAFVATTNNPLVLDFALANWTLDGSGTVHGFVRQGDGSHVGDGDGERQERTSVEGIVTNLTGTAPNLTFTFNYGDDHRSINVATDATTALYNDDGSPNPTLINGEPVMCRGVWKQGVFDASEIRIHNQSNHGHGEPHPVGAEGTWSNVNPVAGTFTINLTHAIDFVPTNMSTTVVVTSKTKCFYRTGVHVGVSEFFKEFNTALPGSTIDLVAKYDGTTLNAIFAIIVPPGKGLGGGPFYQVLLAGQPSNVNQSAGTMNLTIRQWEGFEGSDGQPLNVVTSSSTIYRINFDVVTQDQFYAALTSKSLVAVYGPYDRGTVTATDLAIITKSLGGDTGGGGGSGGGNGGGGD